MTFSIVIMVGRGYFLPTHVHEASIKGQVFLWPDAKDWTDIWDLDGTDRTWEK